MKVTDEDHIGFDDMLDRTFCKPASFATYLCITPVRTIVFPLLRERSALAPPRYYPAIGHVSFGSS